jgi:hypothetical protein
MAGGLRLPMLGPDLGSTFSLEPEVRGALLASRRVGALLLKVEEQEAAAVAEAADALIKREYRWGWEMGLGGWVGLCSLLVLAHAGVVGGGVATPCSDRLMTLEFTLC